MHDGHRERLRNKFLMRDHLEDHERLELLLSFAIPRRNTNDIAHRLLEHFETLDGVFDAEYEHLLEVLGVGEKSALLLSLIGSMRERRDEEDGGTYLGSVGKLGEYGMALFEGCDTESVYALLLSSTMRLVDCVCLSNGTYANAEVDMARLLTNPWLLRSSSVVLLHNHLDGGLEPSDEDREFVARMSELLMVSGIHVIEHIVISGNRFAPTMRNMRPVDGEE